MPVEIETRLRNLAWVEGNRRKVDELTGAGGLRVPAGHGFGGYTNFNRYFFAQWTSRRPSSTSASTAAARRPTT